ncbi:efflux RND transporter periplasmic adaptor subunit [Novosphingobium album (ex Liu et al. 2023)]|uniref:Efflux RND transporter periplasmic adaptor subunit n=1 Tax=Novosphingobium album (ex Liu et al. 2023) TaxID=3031130 RepID=A0ABT5WNL2_9SPHN|nr:efflux RND transporter periplasmic adaptor subunit [Novosphingobium album (ex Liu et al. 2023)]MDE8651624.1 efflux RND transporter periplasmic adaptor subunit [Novosphingobium album (ex Liu et al. 2023)]
MNYDAKIELGDDETALDALTHGDAQDRASRRRMWLILAAIVVVLIGIWFLLHRGNADEFDAAKQEQIPTVSVIQPGRASITGTITATGSLAARREMPVGSAGEGGSVAQVLVDAGAWVEQGQVLAVVDRSVQTQQIAGLASQIDVSAADARLAQANLDRALKLVDRGFISKADVDRLTATRDAAVARVGVARAQLGEMQARTRRLNIVAPAAGLVLERNVEPGQVVTAGSGVLFRIAKDGEMELRARLSEDDLAKLSIGQEAQITPVGLGRSFTGQIWQVAPTINATDRQGEARIALPYARELRPGGFASAEIASGALVAPMLPESAIMSDARGSFVYVVGPNDKVQRRSVRTGTVTAGGIAVIEGLSGTERVVLRAGGFLNEGDAVKARLVKHGG